MKKIKYIVFGVFSLLTMVTTSCSNFLEEEPLDLKTDGQFWTSDADAQSAVNMVYSGGVPYLYGGRNTGWQPTRLMYNGLLSGLFVDDKKDGDLSSNMETLNINFQTVAGDVGELWREPYVSIGRCNVLAKRLPQMVEAGIISEAVRMNYWLRHISSVLGLIFSLLRNLVVKMVKLKAVVMEEYHWFLNLMRLLTHQ